MTRALLAAGSPAGQVLLKFVGGGGTFTRASEGSYYTGPDTLAWATSNVLRGPDLRNASAYPMWLIEAAATNIVVASENLAAASWSDINGATRTATAIVAPDGDADAFTVTFTADALSRSVAAQTAVVSQYTVSAWARTVSGTKQFRLHANNTTDGIRTSADFTATTTWQRFSFTFTNTGIASHVVGVQNGSAATAGDLVTTAVQCELGGAPTSYIRTTVGAVTRAQDSLTYTDMPATMRGGKWTWDHAPIYANGDSFATQTAWGGTGNPDSLLVQVNGFYQYVAPNYNFSNMSPNWSRDQVMRAVVDNANALLTVSGANSGNGTGPQGFPVSRAAGAVRVGALLGSGTPASARYSEPRGLVAAPTAPRIGGFNATPTGYRSAVATIIPGVDTGFGIAMMIRVNSVPSGSQVIAGSREALRGWTVYSSGANLLSNFSNTALAYVDGNSTSIVAADVGRTILFVALYNGANLIVTYRARAAVGVGIACTGYTPADAASRISVGLHYNATLPATSWDVIGLCAFTGVPTLANIQAWDTASKLARRMTSMGGTGVAVTDLWRAEDWSPGNDWTANVGGKVLVREGSPTRTKDTLIWE